LITLADARTRFCPDTELRTLKQRRTRARKTGGGPRSMGVRGRTELYEPAELLRWLTVESLTSTEPSHA
jgi:hypothetical protein